MALSIRSQDWQSDKSLTEAVIYAYEHEIACDVIFHLPKHHEFSAHRLLLSLRSPVFFAMFYGSMAHKDKNVKIEDVDPLAFRELLRFVKYLIFPQSTYNFMVYLITIDQRFKVWHLFCYRTFNLGFL